ncbi:hypothetical protein [Nocardioides sp. CER19]|uniref:hypothetical protein n=1 Tax=Nocardioides sp. CER19 TaxID=3038538 RepID=UPI00244A22D2|nr:hypothetical protein [Nocardioides sp. CER19]MDH2415600.1 hypothetical protein [Nocardioides sp. CER19]
MSSSLATQTAAPTSAPPRAHGGSVRGAGEPGRGWTRGQVVVLLLLAAVPVVGWLPFLDAPLSSDESGYLLLARHWAPGTSLYGDYWVDRPPLLLWLFALAGHLGGGHLTPAGLAAPALKLMGATAGALAVVASGALGGLLAPGSRWSRWGGPVLTAALLTSPMFGMPETDGEILALPLVLLGLTCFVAAFRLPWNRRSLLLAVVSGAAAMAAALVKQNIVDVFVFAAVVLALAHRSTSRPWAKAGAFAAGSVATLVAVLAGAAARGTTPAAVWDATVVFRLQASGVISSSASAQTSERWSRMVSAYVGSGAAAVLVVAAVLALLGVYRTRRSSAPLLWAALAMTAWELFGAAAGGSYWLHYLTGLLPGLVALVALAHPARRGAFVLSALLLYVAGSSATAWIHHDDRPVSVSADAQVATYLRDHARPSDGVVVAFGHPNIVADSGLASPYEHLWSLPVRVRDPRLGELENVMSGPRSPRWIVVSGSRLDSWGLDARDAQRYLQGHYVEQQSYGDWHIWRETRTPASPD